MSNSESKTSENVVAVLGLLAILGLLASLVISMVSTPGPGGGSSCHEAYVTEYVDYGTPYDMGENLYCEAYNNGTTLNPDDLG